MKNYLLVNRALVAEKNINYFNNLFSRVKEHSSPTVNRQSTDGQSQRQYTIGVWKYVAMIFAVLVMSIANIGMAWAVKSTFTKGETIFIYREGDGSAWRDNACVKAYFNDGKGSGSAEYTNWLCNSTSNAKYQVYYTIVPATGYDRVGIERWPTSCTGSKYNDEWTSLQSNRSSDAYNVLFSAAYNNNGWKNETFNFVLKTDVNSWGDAVATFEDKGDGLFQCTYTFTASDTQHYFVVYDNWGHRYGRLADNNNFCLGGLKSGSSCTVVASFKIQDCDANNQKTSLSVMTIHEPGMYVSESGYYQTLATRASDNLKYETYGISKVKYNNTSSTIVLTAAEQVSNSTEYKDKSNLVYVFSNSENFLSAKQWFGSTKYNSTGSASGINTDEFTEHMSSSAQEIKNQAGQEIILCIKGYNQFSMIAKDNDGSSKYFKVEVDGADVTANKKNSATIRRYDISADTHIIRVSGVGGSNSEFWGFSLRPSAPTITASSMAGYTYNQGDEANTMTVTASPVVAGHTLTYTWYSNTSATMSGATQVQSSTSSSYTPSTANVGGLYYVCVVSEEGCNTSTTPWSGLITVNAAGYAVTYNNGGHGTAPSSTTATSVTLTDISTGDWINTGWKANVATTVGGETVAANTLITNGSTVTLSAATTFTAQWSECTGPTQTNFATSGVTDGAHYTGDALGTLTVTAAATNGGSLSYQWKQYDDATGKNNAVNAAGTNNAATYSIPNNATCTNRHYFCIVTESGCSHTLESSISGALTLTEAPTLYTVTYNVNGGESVSPTSATQASSGASVTLPTPTWSGYAFDGWYSAGTKIGVGGASYTPTADITLYAHWTDNISGKLFSYVDGHYGDKCKAFDLSDWVSSDQGGSKDKTYTNGTTGIELSIDDAGWDNKSATTSIVAPMIKFHGTSTTKMSVTIPTGKHATITILYGSYSKDDKYLKLGDDALTKPSSNMSDPVASTSDFATVTLTDKTGTVNGFTTNAGNVYIAKVSAVITGYTVSYAAGTYGSGSLDSGTKTAGSAFTLSSSSSAFTRDGYTYDGWSTKADGSTKDYNLGGSYTTDAVITLYPHWVTDASVSATLLTDTYVPTGSSGSQLSVSVSGASTGWYYRVKDTNTGGYHTPDNTTYTTTTWTMTSGIGTGENPLVVELYNGSNVKQATSGTVSVYGETGHQMTIAAGANGTVSPSGIIYANGDHLHPEITATPNSGYHFVNWTLSNANATLNDATSATTTISSASGACTITANFAAIPVSSISLNKTSTTLTYGGSTETLSVTSVLPANALNKTYTWSSSNDAVATVTSGGVVSPVAAGSCEIYATANDGSDVKGTCAVTVNKADLSVTATAGTATSVTHNSATLPFTLSSTTGVASVTIEVYKNSDNSKVATISGVTAATSGSASATGLSAETTYYFKVKPIGDANHNDGSESAKSATFTTSAAPTAECITWEGDPSSWTGDATPWTMTVSTNLSLKAVGKKWDINSSTTNAKYAKVWVEDEEAIVKTVIAIDDHSVGKYLQGSFADGSEILSLTIGAANNNGTKGTNKKYVVLFSATEAFTNVLAYTTGKYAQEITSPSYMDDYNASNLEKAVVVPSGAKYFRIYRKVVKDWVIGDYTADKDYGDGQTIRIFKIEACPEGSDCTDPTIAWSTTPANGLVGGSMTASVTSNYPAGVSYSSSDATVASVNASTGVISYLKAGSATITAIVVGDGTTYCDLEDKVSQEITVTAVATGIAISPATIDVQVGGTTDLTATLTPAGAANATVNWTSEYTSNATVAIIGDNDKTARVTGVALRPSGEAFKIYAKTASLTANSWYATVRVYKGVTYDATTNEGSCATASAKYYGDAALVLPAATKDGYTFNGWYTTASGVGTKIGETGDEYTPSANSDTLYARFTENVSTYAITYELNSGTHGSTYSATGTPGTAHELSAPTRSGYTFVGWTVSPVVSGAKWGKTSSPDADITDASTLAVNGTSSVYFKNLAAANGAVTITAHWTQDCETSGGGGGSTTLFNVDFTDETTEQIKASTKDASWVAKTYDSYSMSFGSKNADAGVIDIINETGLRFTGNNLNNYNCLAIPLSLTKDKEVTAVITLGDATQIKYNWVSGALPASPNNGTSGSNYGTNNKINTLTYTPTSTGNYVLYLGRNGSESGKVVESIVITQAGGDPVVTPCYHVTYHANGAERGTVEDAARYEEDDLVTVKPNGFTKAGADFLGWATSESRADAGTIDYDPDDDENNSFTMGTADVDLWAVWGTAAPRVYSLTGSTYRCTSDDASTITLAGSETGVDYQLQKDGVDDGAPVSGTGSALNWSKTAWGTYTVVATRSVAVSVDMSGEVVLSDYPLSVTENLDGGTVAQDGEFTLSAKVSVNADNSDDYTYQWFSNDAANYDTPLSLGSATAMDASTGTQQFDYNPSTALGGTKYYFCEFKSPCNTVVRTRVVSVTVTTSTTTLTWDRDGEGDDFEYLPQGGKHTITVSSNSGVAPSLAVAGTDAEITNVEQEGSTTTATLILGASAADVVLTAEVSANGTYAAKSEDKEVIVKECSAGSETVLLSAHLSAYNAFTKDEGSGTATISNAGSDTHVTCSEKNYYKMVNGSTYYTFTLGGKEKFQAGDRIVFDVASSDQGNEKDFNIGLKASTSGSELHSLSTTLTTCDEKVFTIPAGSGLIDGNTVVITRASSENRVYGVSIVRGGGSGSSADVPSGIEWIVNPDPGHDQGSKAITRSISNDPFTYAVRATTPSMGTITYESSDEDVATVDANGRVTLIGEGTTTISAKQEAIGCYLASSTLSYSLTVESCTGEKEPVITYDGTVICPGDIQTLTATNYEDDATFQWYKDGAEIDGADEATYDADEAGTYTVVAHKDCYSESSNSVTLTKMSATVDVKTLADEFTIKSERPYNFRLFEIEDGATMTVQSRSGIDAENSVVTLSGNIISISGTAPTIASAGDATVVIRISRTACTSSYVDKTVTIHKIPATAKPTIAWIATKTTIKDKKEVAVKGVKDEVDADKSSDVDLYQELEKYYTVTARNCYWTTNEADLVKEYSQYDLIVLTDYPNSQTAPSGNDKSKSYTNAIGLLKDHIPMLTFEAYVAQCPNWEIPSNPKNTSETQNDITLLCNADEIFGTEGKFGAGQSITLSTVASGQALQGFLPADAPFVFMGSITDDATTYIACCERQVNPAARMLIFGLNANTMNNLTSDGKQMVHGFIDYLLISDAASIPDCSVIFNGGAGPADQNWNTTANWEGNTMPNQYASVRIDKPCVVSGGEMAEAGYLKIHTSSVGNTYTGKLTIEDDGVMAIQGTITRIEDSKYTLHLPTRPEDLIIKSTASGQGALIFDNESGTTQARVEMYTKAYYDDEKDHWQYVASPLISANRWSLGEWTYQFDNVSGEWDYYVDNFSAFKALALAQDETGTYVFEGTLAPTSNQKIAMPATNAIEGTSLIGNSWTAPIQIVNFQAEDFGNAKASVYIYETGYDPDGGPTNESGNSGERAAGKWYEIPVFGAATLVTSGGWAGMKVIPAMQAFEVKNKSGAPTTFTMNYERLVRNAVNDKNAARRAPQRAMASVETPTLRITMSDGEIRNDVYLLSGERFSEGYDNGWDGEYVGGNNCSQLYALSPIGNLSMSAQPEMEGTILGFAAGTKTEFTITFHYVGEEELYLNDMEAHRSTLISGENEYTFTAESGERGNRFVIGEQLFGAPEITTGVTDLDAENLDVQKVIYNDKLYIIRGGKVFSADGQLVK